MGLVAGVALWRAQPAAEIVNAPPVNPRIVAFGDSLTYGVGAERGQGYPDLLSQRLGRPVINAGYPGDTTGDGLARLENDVLAHQPGIVIICLGGNDYLQRLDLDRAFENLRAMISRIQAGGAMVVLLGLDGLMPFSGIGGEFKALARETGAVFVPDILGGILDDKSLMADNIHPNAAGYRIMTDRVEKALRPYLN